jgi:hypothetical protein
MRFWHFARAALNAGDDGSTPAPTWKFPRGFGSGKLGTPLERMHRANASGPDPPVARVVECEVLWLATVAAVGLGELLPHPASRIPVASTAIASRRASRERIGRVG